MIGLARAREGLYYLEESVGPDKKESLPLMSYLAQSNEDKMWLQHYRMSLPSFLTLKLMFYNLAKGLDFSHFHCVDCELAKHKRVSFPLSNKRTDFLFSLIHSDIWGPSSVPNIFVARWFVESQVRSKPCFSQFLQHG